LVASNRTVAVLTDGVDPDLLVPPVNVLRLSLHPDGMAGRILNLAERRAHLLDRLAREVTVTGDAELAALREELSEYPGGSDHAPRESAGVVVPLRLRVGESELSFLSTVTTFGTAVDVTVAELSIEAFLPADSVTVDAMRAFALPRR
jgi:hypothetical protein